MKKLIYTIIACISILLLAERSAEASSSYYSDLISQGNTLMKAGKLDEAITKATEAIQMDGKNFRGYALQAFILKKQERNSDSEHYLKIAISYAPDAKQDALRAQLALVQQTVTASPEVSAATADVAKLGADPGTTDSMTALFGDPDIVKGDGFSIKSSELDEVVIAAKANAGAQKQHLPDDFVASTLEQLISIHLLLLKATDADRAIGKTDSDQQYNALIKRFGSEEALNRQLLAVGMSEGKLRSKAEQEATAKAALKRLLEVAITDAEVNDYYSSHPSDFVVPESVKVQHILLMTVDPSTQPPTQLSSDIIAAKREQIERLLKRLRAGEDFSTLAKEYSEDPSSKENGGELPEFTRGKMVLEFETAAFSLSEGQISDVVSTVYGFHIIKLLKQTAAHSLELSDKSSSTNLTIAEELRQVLTNNKIRKLAPAYVKRLRSESHVQIIDAGLKVEDDALIASRVN